MSNILDKAKHMVFEEDDNICIPRNSPVANGNVSPYFNKFYVRTIFF